MFNLDDSTTAFPILTSTINTGNLGCSIFCLCMILLDVTSSINIHSSDTSPSPENLTSLVLFHSQGLYRFLLVPE